MSPPLVRTGGLLSHVVELARWQAAPDSEAEEKQTYIAEAISMIEREQMLPPMAVLQLLSQGSERGGGGVPLSVARDYLLRHLQAGDAAAIRYRPLPSVTFRRLPSPSVAFRCLP